MISFDCRILEIITWSLKYRKPKSWNPKSQKPEFWTPKSRKGPQFRKLKLWKGKILSVEIRQRLIRGIISQNTEIFPLSPPNTSVILSVSLWPFQEFGIFTFGFWFFWDFWVQDFNFQDFGFSDFCRDSTSVRGFVRRCQTFFLNEKLYCRA